MPIAVCDSRGRITLGRGVIETYGKRFSVVKVPSEIVLIPIPKDPLKAFAKEGRKIPKRLTLEDLKKIAEATARKEAVRSLNKLYKKR